MCCQDSQDKCSFDTTFCLHFDHSNLHCHSYMRKYSIHHHINHPQPNHLQPNLHYILRNVLLWKKVNVSQITFHFALCRVLNWITSVVLSKLNFRKISYILHKTCNVADVSGQLTYSYYLASMPLPPDVLPVMAIKTTDIMQYVNDLLKSCKRKCNRDNHGFLLTHNLPLNWPFSCLLISCFESMIAIWARL